MPLEFITFNDVTIVARLNAIFLFCKIAYTTIFGRITSAWQKWVVYRDISSSTIKRVAAQQIQNIALFWSSAVHLITAKKKISEKSSADHRHSAEKVEQLLKHCVKIRRILVCYATFLKAQKTKSVGVAALGIQTMAKRKEVQIRNTTMVFRLSRQTYAAGIIQRSFRGMVIRRVAKQARQQKHQHSVLGRYHNPLACTIYEFEQQGAAHRIQSVLRTRPFCLGVIRCLGIQKYCSTILYRVRHWQFHRKLSAYFGSRLQSHLNKRSLKIAAASTIERTMRKCYQQEKIKKNPTTRRVERTRVSVASSAGIVKLDLDTADVRTMCKYKNSQYLNNKGIVHIQSLQRGSHARKHVAALRTQHVVSSVNHTSFL